MKYREFREKAFDLALRCGCGAAETYSVSGESFMAGVLEGELDRYSSSRAEGLGLRVQVGGKNGYAYTERLIEPEVLVRMAMDNAASIETEDVHPMQSPAQYRSAAAPANPLVSMSGEERIALAMQMEQYVKGLDARVKRVQQCAVTTSSAAVRIHNTLGLCAEREATSGYCLLAPILEQGGERKNAYAFRMGTQSTDIEDCAREAVSEAAAQFGASPVAAGDYRVLLRADAAADLLEAFTPMFSADRAQKGLSLLNGREGERIADAWVHIIDDPFYPERPRPFDGEGTPTEALTVVKDGVLITLLHNLKTAQKAGVRTTGHAARSASSAIGIAPSNFYIAPGAAALGALHAELYDGLFITGVSGLHAGVNTISGQFSLIAKGFLVERGEVARPVESITVAGSFLHLLQDVQNLGNDLRFGLPGGGCIGAPSLLVGGLKVSGK